MQKLLFLLHCLPMIGFEQDNNKKKQSRFKFNKSNNCNAKCIKKIRNKHFNSNSKFHVKKSLLENKYFSFLDENKSIFASSKSL